ncbi:hypothetical protein C8R44DRAFT_981807 [Mycena epipterygia]|nr:hypothetical protein C8R44DRAFT_981807 [Mycena epipterygia]
MYLRRPSSYVPFVRSLSLPLTCSQGTNLGYELAHDYRFKKCWRIIIKFAHTPQQIPPHRSSAKSGTRSALSRIRHILPNVSVHHGGNSSAKSAIAFLVPRKQRSAWNTARLNSAFPRHVIGKLQPSSAPLDAAPAAIWTLHPPIPIFTITPEIAVFASMAIAVLVLVLVPESCVLHALRRTSAHTPRLAAPPRVRHAFAILTSSCPPSLPRRASRGAEPLDAGAIASPRPHTGYALGGSMDASCGCVHIWSSAPEERAPRP